MQAKCNYDREIPWQKITKQYRGYNAKEESFWSSFSRKACGELERQSLSVKAQKRREHNQNNSRLSSDYKARAIPKNFEREQIFDTHTNYVRKNCPRPPSNSDSAFDGSTRTK